MFTLIIIFIIANWSPVAKTKKPYAHHGLAHGMHVASKKHKCSIRYPEMLKMCFVKFFLSEEL